MRYGLAIAAYVLLACGCQTMQEDAARCVEKARAVSHYAMHPSKSDQTFLQELGEPKDISVLQARVKVAWDKIIDPNKEMRGAFR